LILERNKMSKTTKKKGSFLMNKKKKPGRPKGTTRANGYKVSSGRPRKKNPSKRALYMREYMREYKQPRKENEFSDWWSKRFLE